MIILKVTQLSVCWYNMVLEDIIAHHLGLLKPHEASQAGSSSKDMRGDIQKPLPNQYTECELAGHGRAPGPAVSLCAVSNSPRRELDESFHLKSIYSVPVELAGKFIRQDVTLFIQIWNCIVAKSS